MRRNIRFGFHGNYRGALAAYVGWGLLAVVTLYLLLPSWLYRRTRFLLSHTSYGTERFAFEKTAGVYIRFYYKSAGLLLAVALGTALLVVTIISGAASLGPSAADQASASTTITRVVATVLGIVGGFAALLTAGAYYERSSNNAAFDGLRIGPHRLRCQLRARRLLWLYVTNIFGILFTLGLFYPWALVRRLRYQIESMAVEAAGSLEQFSAAVAPDPSAVGEELGEFFDVDFGF